MALQLRQQEFPKIGALNLDESASTLEVCNRPLSVEMALQELEGLDPSKIVPRNKTYTTCTDYVTSLLQLALHDFEASHNAIYGKQDGRRALYALYEFKRLATEWVSADLDHGPFVLMHGDLLPANYSTRI